MAWPGSWWEFDNGEIDNCGDFQEFRVLDHQYDSDGCTTAFLNKVYLPYHDRFGFIHSDYRYWNYGDSTSHTHKRPVVSALDPAGSVLFEYSSDSGTDMYTSTKFTHTIYVHAIYDSMTVGISTYYDVIVIRSRSHLVHAHLNNGPTENIYYYFAKNVGLIRRERTDEGVHLGLGPGDTINLVNYWIEPH